MAQKESRYYAIQDVPIPDSVELEVGGIAFNDRDQLGVATRRGEIWLIDQPYGKSPQYTRFASGLHEPLFLSFNKGSFYTTQRAELTKMTDTDGDGKADLFNVIYAWPLAGNYHEYSYGPLFLPNGDMLVTLNLGWEGKGKSLSKWHGWMLKITEDGKMTPFAAGMRSPAGIGLDANGEVFFAENQGDWIGSGRITHLNEGDFAGHPASLRWAGEPESPIDDLTLDDFPDSIGRMYDFAKEHPRVKLPTIWFPHTLMGISTSAILAIKDERFGPFKGQLLVGDQGHSKVMRAFLEKVDGEYQGACFPFREGFSSGILRTAWGSDHSLFVGMTSRGWPATGKAPFGLQRLVWTGKTPFEIKAMRALHEGFELEFTQPVNRQQAADPKAYQMTSFTYLYHRRYGSPIVDQLTCEVTEAKVSADGKRVTLTVNGLREGYIHELKLKGITAQNGTELLHPLGYYTLNHIPGGAGDHQHHVAMMQQQAAQGEAGEGCGTDPTKSVSTQPADWANGPDVTITIGTKPGLKYDLEAFEIEEGSRVKVVFQNSDDMLHNLVITTPGSADKVGKAAMDLGIDGSKLGYIPDLDDVLYHTCLMQPETSQAIYFTAPKVGDYPYVCTFPGHYYVMRGLMKVVGSSKAAK
ncbi:plastocyanin/azurin family copper-binding protein [Catalinimonas alkaloidigena]|nr:plastocyanin/azurin family copper-binding protein [Catalinimonas alkaloidigena]